MLNELDFSEAYEILKPQMRDNYSMFMKL